MQGPCQGPHMVTSQSREWAVGSRENQGLGDVLCQLARETRDSRSGHRFPEFGCGRTLCSNKMLEKSPCTINSGMMLVWLKCGWESKPPPLATPTHGRLLNLQAQWLLTEAVLGADVDVSALHSITVAIGAGLDAGGAGGEVPGNSWNTQQASHCHAGTPPWLDGQSQKGGTLGPPRPILPPLRRSKLRPEPRTHP